MAVEKKQRQVSFEWLRILAMCMIVILHYLSKGGFLTSLTGDVTTNGYVAWFIEAFCLVAVNVYILISGYFGCQSSMKFQKVISLWGQVAFYAIGIGVIAILLGLVPMDTVTLYTLIQLAFPIVTEHYWFATSYIFLLLLMPFLNAGLQKLQQKELQKIIAGMLLLFCIAKTVLPMHLPWDKLGYDVLWFICLYLTGAYIRIYGFPILKNKIQCLLLYIMSAFVTFILTLVIRLFYMKTGSLEDFISYAYSYNHFLCYLGALGLFGVVAFWREKDAGQKIKTICLRISGATFGVYLIHEHLFIRYVWPKWLKAETVQNTHWFLPHMILSVVMVYVVCTILELGRQKLFSEIAILLPRKSK